MSSNGINLSLPDETADQLIDRVIDRMMERGLLSQPKPWLTMEEAVDASGLSEWEIRKRIKQGRIETHQPNPGKPPLRINRNSLLRSMGSVIDSDASERKEA